MDSGLESSIVGTIIQVTGTVLVSLLCHILLQTVRRPFLYYWAYGWGSLTAALLALVVAFVSPATQPYLLPVYCFMEYVAGFLWVAGCRNLGSGYRIARSDLTWGIPAALAAIAAPQIANSVNGLMAFHALILAGIFGTAFAVLYHDRAGAKGAGSGVMMAAFFLLMVDFLQYAPLCAYAFATNQPNVFPHMKYSALYDLMLEMLLAFGMVMVVMEYVRRELESANQELRQAGSRFKRLAERDPLTGALNRHAFEELCQEAPRGGPFAGVLAVLDIDNLKPINDTLGHAAGDRTIQLVAQAIRSVVRPDDLLFRWGGDEFLILWVGQLKEADAEMRLERLNEELARNARAAGLTSPVEPGVSFGLATFADRADVEKAIELADERMYARKQAKKKSLSNGVVA